MRPILRTLLGAAVLTASCLLVSCGEEDAASIKVVLNNDFSGTVSTSSVVLPASGAPAPALESASSGVNWTSRGELVMSTGTFSALGQLKIADITFEYDPKAPTMARVTLPRGPQAKWPALFTATDRSAREHAAAALAPGQKTATIGAVVTINLKLPAGQRVVSSGAKGIGRGMNASMEETSATLTVPVEVALGGGLMESNATTTEPLVWHVTWEPMAAAKP